MTSSKLPEGWRIASVADVCEMRNGHGFGPNDWDTTGLPIIRIQNMNGGKSFDYFSGTPEPQWIVERDQLLFAWAGTKGVSFGPAIWRGPRGVLNQHIFQVEPKKDIDPTWLFWALREVTDRIEGQAHDFKATLVHVKKSDIDRQTIFVPPLSEQRRAAQLLSAWDGAIEVTEKLIERTKQQTLMLGETLLSGQRRLLMAPVWERKPISALIAESRIRGASGDTAKKVTVKLYGLGVIRKNEKRLGSESTQYYRRKSGQFIYSKLDFLNGAFGLIPTSLDGYESTLDMPAFDFIGDVDPRWFLHYIARPRFYSEHVGLANGGRKARRVNPVDLLRVVVSVPSIAEQQAIADLLELATRKVKNIERQLTLLKKQRKSLMQEVLGGMRRIRLSELNAEVTA